MLCKNFSAVFYQTTQLFHWSDYLGVGRARSLTLQFTSSSQKRWELARRAWCCCLLTIHVKLLHCCKVPNHHHFGPIKCICPNWNTQCEKKVKWIQIKRESERERERQIYCSHHLVRQTVWHNPCFNTWINTQQQCRLRRCRIKNKVVAQ